VIASAVGLVLLLVAVFAGIPLGISMIVIGVGGFAMIRGFAPSLTMAGQQIFDLATNYDLSVLPMFLLMGIFVQKSRLSEDLYRVCHNWLGHLPGGLALATIGASGGFAAVCGSSLASAATMTKMAMPSMRKFRYADDLAAASIAAGGTLGILIPPSVPMVIYGIMTQTDIGALFIAGIVPGIVLMFGFFAAVLMVTAIRPSAGPRVPATSWRDRFKALGGVWAVAALFVLVLGGIYFGVFTPTEAAGIGSAGALAFCLWRRSLGFRDFIDSLLETGRTTASIFFIAFGALIFSNFLTLTGMISQVVTVATDLGMGPTELIIFICIIYLLLGCVFESLGMMILTVPVFFPVARNMGIDPIWFGIIVVICVELGLITPPIGLNLFVVKRIVGDIDIVTLYRGIWPFVMVSVLVLALVIVLPQLAVFLPGIMAK
jgi:C4-dicarboxylate transporter, DctM subunit